MRRRPARQVRLIVSASACALALAACTAPAPAPASAPRATTQSATGSAEPNATTASPSAGSQTEAPASSALAWGPTEADLAAATALAAAMTPEEVAGQVILARYPGTTPASAADVLTRYHLAGLVLFSENVDTLDQVIATGAAVQDAQAEMGRTWPAIVSVDNEGGIVQRLGAQAGPWTSFPEFAAAGAADDPAVVSAAAQAMATELRASGLNVDFAPDADVTIGPADAAIGTRSAGADPALVSRTVSAALQGFAAGGILTSMKHFPGHGSLTVDSHAGLPVQDASAADLAARDLAPFADGIDAGAPMVMVGHIAVTDWDPGVPASLSPQAYRVLREDLGFTGVAITDALDMGALTQTRTPAQIATEALAAGADLLLGPTDVGAAHRGIVGALADGSLARSRVDEAAGRVIALMRWQATLAAAAGAVTSGDVGSGAAASRALSDAALTMVSGPCSGSLVGERIHVRGGSTADWEAFVAAAEAGGLDVVPLEQAAETDVRLLTGATPSGSADVAIALDEPWMLGESAAATRIAAYGHTEQTFDAVVGLLTGAQGAPGHLPIPVAGLPASACG